MSHVCCVDELLKQQPKRRMVGLLNAVCCIQGFITGAVSFFSEQNDQPGTADYYF